MMLRHFITNMSPDGQVMLGKLIGALAGSLISLAYILPRGKREAAIRFFTGLSAGIVFGLPVGIWLSTYAGISGQLSRTDMALMGSAVASLTIWTALGVGFRLAQNLTRLNPNFQKLEKDERRDDD